MLRRLVAAVALLALVAPPHARAQTPQPQDEIIRVDTKEVGLDVVVRDKRGHVVKDLRASDFEVFEDGRRQQVQSFRLVARGAAARPAAADAAGAAATTPAAGAANTSGAAGSARAAPESPRGIERVGAVALVFDRLSVESRARARQAALGFLSGGLAPDDYVGVFRVDLSLQAVQTFTNNEQHVRAGIERAMAQGSSAHDRRAGQMAGNSVLQSQLESQQENIRSGGGLSGAGTDLSAIGGAAASNAFASAAADMTQRSLETFEQLERNQQGYATMNGLLAVISAMARLPGRKVLILFSEGLSVPPAVESPFRAVISNANRAGVSIYAVDAAGLRATSADAETGRALTALGSQRIRQAASNREPGRPMMRDLERNEDLLRYNPDSGLGQLADQTGGFLVKDTNNPGARLRQVDEDLHTYYALSYVPENQNYDGRFRQISVRVNRPNVEVQARKGYYALDTDASSPLLPYEVPALALLSGARDPASFPARAAAFHFPDPRRPGLVPVVVEVPGGSISFSVDEAKKTFATDFAVVALLRDESQRVVGKLSQQYRLTGPLGELEATRRGGILFYREAELPPGRYTVAAAAYDATTARASVTSATVEVPAPRPGPALASVVLIKRAERVAAGAGNQTDGPFRYGELLVYPYLDEPVRKSAVKELAFLLTVYAPRGSTSAPRLTVEIRQGARTLGKSSPDLPAPGASGRIQFASTVPVEQLPPGSYELRVTASDAQGTATRTERFTIQ
jgi:VWFA-related protein